MRKEILDEAIKSGKIMTGSGLKKNGRNMVK